ncbi:LysM peptidoglycan-binding domain-containing protein [Paenalkalicoccus suaedae]|uniref:LysM peptidoglycan-binding domain-containing protein n=1 Tax=Paenalkalicoccus suaedae TaxID=2592382 RepID=A0A859FDS1_9BACI|nr:LysM peptidoglycan-binding domain-containing protein [Paenalkalicoccus suaedae]QKS71349.1 LysM peptidoglycan-binding domain-containing protein [Paenalkalicoccus suaedae]
MKTIRQYVDGSIFLIVIAVGFFAFTFFSSDSNDVPFYPAEERVVSEGDSLWTIARTATVDLPIEETINWMKHENGLDNETIVPGQKIHVPVSLNGVASD